MKPTAKAVTVTHVYILEGENDFDKALQILRDEEQIAGVTVMRGIASYGTDKEVHTSSLLTLSLELPVIIEFFDEPERVAKAIANLSDSLKLKHIVSWPATLHTAD